MKQGEITEVVRKYAKRKKYELVTGPDAQHVAMNSDIIDTTLISAVKVESDVSNQLIVSNAIISSSSYLREFSSLQQFILLLDISAKAYLIQLYKQLVYKTFFQLLISEQLTTAHSLLTQCTECLKPENSQIIDLLLLCHSSADFEKYPDLHVVRKIFQRTSFIIPEVYLKILLAFLKEQKCVAVLQTLNQQFVIKSCKSSNPSSEIEIMTEAENYSNKFGLKSSEKSNLVLKSEKMSCGNTDQLNETENFLQNENHEAKLLKIIRQINEDCLNLPAIAVYDITNSKNSVTCSQFSSASNELCVGYNNNTIVLYNLTSSPKYLPSLDTNSSLINLSNDFQNDIEIKLNCDRMNVNGSIPMKGHCSTIRDLSFPSTDEYLLSASDDKSVRLWNLKSCKDQAVYHGHNGTVWSIHCSPLNQWFVSGSHDRSAKLWSTDRLFPLRIFLGHELDVTCARFHPNANYIATSSFDCTIRLWNVQDGRCVRLFHGQNMPISCIEFSPDGRYLCSTGYEDNVKIWDINSGSIINTIECNAQTLKFNKQGSLLATGDLAGHVKIWKFKKLISTANEERQIPHLKEASSVYKTSSAIQKLHFAAENLLLVVG